jgi:predicted ATPase
MTNVLRLSDTARFGVPSVSISEMPECPSENVPLLREITPRNLLSFGPDTTPIELNSLNVLIGPNGSGKSNFIEVLSLLRATPGDMRKVTQRGGGAKEWIWKGDPEGVASIDVVLSYPTQRMPLRHALLFRVENQTRFLLEEERIEDEKPSPLDYYGYASGRSRLLKRKMLGTGEESWEELPIGSIDPERSILAQRRDPEAYPEVSHLATSYEQVRVYREWTFGRNSVFRIPQQADMRNDRLEEDFSNLGLFLNRLRRDSKTKRAILNGLQDLYDGITDYDISVEGGAVQVFFTEGEFTIPATRLSDGTLRYLCLLAILCDPKPPPLICIEEPELGLHPDILPKVADLLVSASERAQLIVTTHSDILVDAMTERPEAILVCEKHNAQTVMKRLDEASLARWLDKISHRRTLDPGRPRRHPLVNVKLHLEGGGDSKELQIRCREAFSKLIAKAGFAGRMPRIKACGSRDTC